MNMRIDVSDVLLDPDFADYGLTYLRRSESVDTHGRTVLASASPITFTGVVTSDKGDILERTDSSSRVHGTIIIHTPTVLRIDGEGFDADIVTWNGKNYLVTDINDYSTYGRGFIVATCSIVPLAG